MGKASEVGLKCGRSLRESGQTGGWAGLGTIVARKWVDLRYILGVKEGEFVKEFPWDEG